MPRAENEGIPLSCNLLPPAHVLVVPSPPTAALVVPYRPSPTAALLHGVVE